MDKETAEKFVLHSITIENDEQEIIARFNNSEDFSTYMIDLNMDLSRDDDEGYSKDYLDHIHIFHNVMLEDDEIHGLNEKQYSQLIQESQNVRSHKIDFTEYHRRYSRD